ncbi:Golgi-body localization protein domain [Heracleum sosnowskyi]|uniref:Golgi-body localization protein domain n=1 Tax=Heracleum sosnowskyi TaxID=360622 RepID=A0AAD8I4T5_9APIA|nr:Golgi-body localization protein domain [Heracleum sosnowskyi]
MAATYFLGFIFSSIFIPWLLIRFGSSLVALIVGRIVGASVKFRVGGCNCLRDVVVKFRKGAIESVSIGEIRLSLRQSLAKLGVGFISRDPKLQVIICKLEVTLRTPQKGTQKKTRPRKSGSSSKKSGKGKWMVIANVARLLSVSITELVLKTSKATIEIKELGLDISKVGGSNPTVFVRLLLLPIIAHLGIARDIRDQLSSSGNISYNHNYQTPSTDKDKAVVPFLWEEFFLSCELGHVRDAGLIIKNFEVSSGDIFINLKDEMFLRNKSSSDSSSHANEANIDSTTIKSPHKKQSPNLAITKVTYLFPEKVSINLPKIDINFEHGGSNFMAKNNVSRIQLKSTKSRYIEDVGDSTRLDVQLDFGEIHLLKENDYSVLEILKLDIVSSVTVPVQPTSPTRIEVDLNLGDLRCNLAISRLKPLMQLKTSKRKNAVIPEETPKIPIPERSQSIESKSIMWTCTFSGPEMTLVLYNLDGLAVHRGCCQSSHVFANNKSNTGTSAHIELGELNLKMAEEYQESLTESLIGVDTNTGSLMHIAKISLDWGKKNRDPHGEEGSKSITALSVDLTGMDVHLTFKHVESLVSIVFSFKSLLKKKKHTSSKNQVQSRGHSSKPSGKGIRIIKFNMDRCFVIFSGDVGVENTSVADPKRVNYGSQGGTVTISESADGTQRTAKIMSTCSDEYNSVNYSVSLEIFHFSLSVNKDKQSVQIDLERAESLYQEHMRGNCSGTKVALLDILNAKFVRRSGGLKEIDICSLFSATDITTRWEPDMHIALFELMLRVKLLVHNQRFQEHDSGEVKDSSIKGETEHEIQTSTNVQSEKHKKKKESIFAIDVQMLSIYVEAGDGVDAMVQVQSIFSENASIGVLLEGLLLKFNDARIFCSSRMQVSRVPKAKSSAPEVSITWDWVVQALDVHVCMPFRLELRAIDDAVEEMIRALKLITAAKTNMLLPKKNGGVKPKKASSSKLGCVRLCIRKLTADIEEEPIQGWLDEHYHLMKNEARELAVRLNFFDEVISGGSQSFGTAESINPTSDEKMNFEGEKIDLKDALDIQKMREEIYKKSFNSYYKACQNLVKSEGSGACKVGFQSGFKPSTSRTSLFSISATDLDVSLTKIEGGETGMIEHIQKLDPISQKYNIPFSRMYGSNMLLHTGSLSVQIRNYTYPLLCATSGRCQGRVILAQQATCFQAQTTQDVYIGRWRKVCMLRSASGTTPPMKTYLDLPLHFQKGDVSFGVGYEPSLTDLSYAFTVALRRANLSVRNPNASIVQPPKKEKSLPWWDEMRNYVHGNSSLNFSETRWNILATTDPYEKSEKLQIVSDLMEVHQSDGRISASAKGFKILMSSLESLLNDCGLKPPPVTPTCFLEAPAFSLEVTMDWECASGDPLNHFLFALPNEGVAREFIYDPFRSTSLSLRFNLSLRPCLPSCENKSGSSSVGENTVVDGDGHGSPNKPINASADSTTIIAGPHDFAWLFKFWNLNFIPPQKLRFFSRWPRFGVPRIPRSGNLSLDRVMTEFMFRVDSSPFSLRHMPLDDDDLAKGLTFKMSKLKFELCFGRGKQKFTFESKRDLLESVYQGLDLHMLKVYINKDDCPSVTKLLKLTKASSQSASLVKDSSERHRDDGFFLSSNYFTVRKQSQKADSERLLAWQEAERRNPEMTPVRSKCENGSDSDEHTRSDPSDDDGFNMVIADNCQRIFVYGLKLLWTIENRDAIWSFAGGLSKAFQPPKPSPSRQYAQRKLVKDQEHKESQMPEQNDLNPPSNSQDGSSTSSKPVEEPSGTHSSPSESATVEKQSLDTVVKELVSKDEGVDNAEEEGTRHFMVNVVEPQFNLHAEDANGRFLLAAASGRVLARSFRSVLHVGYDIIEPALKSSDAPKLESQPELTWNRMEFSVMLEHVQAHVAPTDVDPGAGVQWLPKIRRSSQKVKRTGALLERVFMPCDMYFRYTTGGTSDMKVKPLKELAFNSQNITATMTSRQFQVMLDVLTNLLFSRYPKVRSRYLSLSAEDGEDVEEEVGAVVPDGVEEVELERVNLEQKERMLNLLLDDIRKLSLCSNGNVNQDSEKDDNLWIVTGGTAALVQGLNKELVHAKESRKDAYASLGVTLKEAAQIRIMEKEKNKSPSYAMRISMQMNKVVWGMLVDGKTFAEAEINDMIYDYDRDYKDIGVSRFTTKYFVVRNCLPNAKCDTVLSAWNPPSDWGKNVMLGVDARQGAPKDGRSPIELFQAELYPLKIYVAETMYHMMWVYLFPEEKQDSQRRQEVWKVSTAAGSRRQKKDSDTLKAGASAAPSNSSNNQPSVSSGSSQASKIQSSKGNTGSTRELRRTSSFDRSWEETVAESVANELVLQAHSSGLSSSKSGHHGVDQEESSKNKLKETKPVKSGRSSQDDKKVGKPQDEKRSKPTKLREFHNIKISQVELLISYEGSRFSVSDLRLLMDAFNREEFTGTWGRLFARIKKHIVWSVLKSFTGMQGKKFKDKSHSHKEVIATSVAENDHNLSDGEGVSTGKSEHLPGSWPNRSGDGAGDGFVTSIRGLFGTKRRKAKAFVLRTMRGEADSKQQGEWSDNDAEFSPYARQLTVNKTKKLIRRHTKKLRSKGKKGTSSQQTGALSLSPEDTSPVEKFRNITSSLHARDSDISSDDRLRDMKIQKDAIPVGVLLGDTTTHAIPTTNYTSKNTNTYHRNPSYYSIVPHPTPAAPNPLTKTFVIDPTIL